MVYELMFSNLAVGILSRSKSCHNSTTGRTKLQQVVTNSIHRQSIDCEFSILSSYIYYTSTASFAFIKKYSHTGQKAYNLKQGCMIACDIIIVTRQQQQPHGTC